MVETRFLTVGVKVTDKQKEVARKSLGRPKSNNTPVAKAPLASKFWFLIPLLIEGARNPWKKWLILGLREVTYKMSLEHLVLLENKGVLWVSFLELP